MIELSAKYILIYLSIYTGLFAFFLYVLSFFRRNRKKYELIKETPDNKLPFVSILIPAYNESRNIVATIKSISTLDYPKDKLEILILDDGSKDNTYELAKKYEKGIIKVFRNKHSGKAGTLNFGISKSKGEIIVSMDADTIITKDCLKKMIPYFWNKDVMCVAPSIAIYKPRTLWQRIQQIEYLMGFFLRRAFGNMNAIHVTPGAFSAYRRELFEKYGGYDTKSITEDLELALRIQSKNLVIECNPSAVVFTKAPETFYELLKQRRRWYSGLIVHLRQYKRIFSKEHGALGTVILPLAISGIILSISLFIFLIVETIINLKKQIIFLKTSELSLSFLTINNYLLEKFFFNLFSNPVVLFFLFFMIILFVYLSFARRRLGKYRANLLAISLFLGLYYLLVVIWWLVSLFYTFFRREVKWTK